MGAQHRTSPTHTKMKFLKNGRVAIIIQPQDSGSKAYPFPHALVAGIERYPLKVTKRMGKKRSEKRSTVELEGLKNIISHDTFKEVSQREEAKKNVKKALEERYTSGKNRWFFTPLRF